jgi:hypothetical protein
MNRTQRQQYTQAEQQWLEGLAEHCDYAITLQTNLRTYAVSESTREVRLQATREALRRFRLRLNRLLTGNGWTRNADYVPIFVASIEGVGSKDKTVHIHAAVGNVGHAATEETRQLVEEGCRQIWLKTDVCVPINPNLLTSPLLQVAKDDVVVRLMRDDAGTGQTKQRWMGYMGKEAAGGNWSVMDWS